MSALVSIVVPVFNGMPHLPAAAESLLGQDYGNIEIIFSDGGSSDSSREYLFALSDPRVRVVDGPVGASANWTFATKQARGAFIKLVCQDDVLNADAVGKQVQDLERHPTAVMAIAQRDIIDARGNVLYRRRGLAGLHAPLLSGDEVIRRCYLAGTNVIGEPLAVLFRADVLDSRLPWDDSNPLMLDLSMYERLAPAGDIVLRHESVGGFRVSASSWSTRLVKVQLQQTKQWQRQYADRQITAPGMGQRAMAFAGRHRQTALRRVAYRVLQMKGAFESSEGTGSLRAAGQD